MKKVSELQKRESNIHGEGVFAREEIKKEQLFYRVPTESTSHSPKPRWAHIGDGFFVSDEKVLNHVNHSCEPNSEMVLGEEVWLRALRDIEPEEEITVDYNRTEQGGVKVRCSCGSEKCRGCFLRIE